MTNANKYERDNYAHRRLGLGFHHTVRMINRLMGWRLNI
jgi:hypothetical protein